MPPEVQRQMVLRGNPRLHLRPIFTMRAHEIRLMTNGANMPMTMAAKIRTLRWLPLLLCAGMSAPVSAETLGEAMAIAYQHNPGVEASRASTRAAEERMRQAKAQFGPTLTADASYRYAWRRVTQSNVTVLRQDGFTPQLSLSLDQPLFTFGRLSAQRNIAQAGYGASVADMHSSEQDLMANVVIAYAAVLRDEKLVGIARENLSQLTETLDQINARYTARYATETDLQQTRNRIPIREAPMPLPRPNASLEVQGVVCGPPGRQKVTVANVSFRLSAGEALAVIGHSGSGKSTLMRAVTGAWPLLRGAVRLDGASLEQWDPVFLGRDIGYVPQAIELFDGTLAQNIARFDAEADPEAIIAAARAADVHDMIVALPGGYEYVLGGSGGGRLSAGQKQRIALARALYGDPFLIVLDEPNSNLDAAGEDALVEAVRAAKQRGAIVVIVGHRPTVFAHVDHIMIMADGQLMQMGERTEMLKRINFNPAPQSPSTQSAE